MKRNKFFSRFITVTLTVALLLTMGSRAIRVSALADPVQSITPVFDTQIYQLQDYIDNGGLSSSQLDIFYTLAGFYVLGQAGSSGYKLVDPYANTDSVWEWLKSCGIEIYNTVIGLIPDTARMPITGNLYSTIPFKKASQLYVSTLMGAAVKAATFSSYQDFKDEVINSQSYYLPWNLDVQKGLNSIFGIYNGIYQWQFNTDPFTSNFTWHSLNYNGSYVTTYNQLLSQLPSPITKINSSGYWYNTYASLTNISDYNTLYINSNTGDWGIYKTESDYLPLTINLNMVYYYSNNGSSVTGAYNNTNSVSGFSGRINLSNYATIQEAVQHIYDNSRIPLENLINHVYIGTNWLNKTEIFNLTDLNLDSTDQQYFDAVPNNNDYLFDIKGILTDILNDLDLYGVFIDNLVDIDGVPVHDTDLIRITTSIYDLLEETNPILPVNLNDISQYTDNNYLDVVKERATSAGSTLAALVAFWHNCDAELIYVMFGAGITVLVGAFIGKWGHS